jgi:hypothetical protein
MMGVFTLLFLDTADKVLAIYLFALFSIWIFIKMLETDKSKSRTNTITPVVYTPPQNISYGNTPTNYIQNNFFVSIKIWVNGIERVEQPGEDGGERQLIYKPPVISLPKKNYELNCSKIEFIRAIISWCRVNLDENKARTINLDLKYIDHKTLSGEYRYYTKTIVIYWGSNRSLESICKTCIHEFSHAQNITCKNHQAEYDKLTKQRGYDQNPHEILARKISESSKSQCLTDLYKLNYLK